MKQEKSCSGILPSAICQPVVVYRGLETLQSLDKRVATFKPGIFAYFNVSEW